MEFFLNFLLIILILYVFCRLIFLLYKKGTLNKEDISQIVKLMCKTLVKRLDEMTIKLEMDEDAIDLIAKSGFDLEYGARPLKRSIQKELENELSELILQGTIKSGDIVEATVKEGKMTFEVK